MIPVSLKLSNFTSYSDGPKELDFRKFHLAAISGPNGAGKSSLLDAITWCLWGQSRTGDSSDSLVHLGKNDMWVEFSFKLDGGEFTIKRQRSKKGGGSTSLELWSGSYNLTEGTIKATQEKIINLLHLSFETFTNSAFLRQGHADEFTTKGPTDRKRILSDILGLSDYDILEEKAKDKVKEIQAKLQLLEYQLLEIEAELSQKDEREKELDQTKQKVSKVESEIKILEQEINILQKEKETLNIVLEQRQKMEQNLNFQRQELEQIVSQGKQRADRIKELEQSISNLENMEKELLRLKFLKKEADKLIIQNQKKLEIEKQISEVSYQIKLKDQQRNLLGQEIDQLKKQVTTLEQKGAKCPTCGQLINKDQKHQIKLEIANKLQQKQNELSKIKTQDEENILNKLVSNLKEVTFDEKKLENIQTELKQLEDLQKQKENALQNKAALETERKTVEDLRALYKNKEEQVKVLEKEAEKLPQIDQDLGKVKIILEQKENRITNLRLEEKQVRGLLGRAEELISRSKQLEKLQEEKQKDKSNLQKEKEILDELQFAFGKKGIQAMIIESAIPEIEDEANSLLDKLTDGRMKISLLTQRETKTKLESGEKGIIETLDIIISDEMGERSYEAYSGGEQFRVNFAIRLAISKLLTRRAGAKLQFLVIDEGFGTQDVEGRTRIVEVLDAIKNDFEKILVITHLEELKEEFPVRIEVSKNAAGSTFEVVGV
ncbi:SMC family ATPase [Candidatus Microgenomates bacterium]|nr:SMC family ATPase [Candidatus Microgenomates bacterium]